MPSALSRDRAAPLGGMIVFAYATDKSTAMTRRYEHLFHITRARLYAEARAAETLPRAAAVPREAPPLASARGRKQPATDVAGAGGAAGAGVQTSLYPLVLRGALAATATSSPGQHQASLTEQSPSLSANALFAVFPEPCRALSPTDSAPATRRDSRGTPEAIAALPELFYIDTENLYELPAAVVPAGGAAAFLLSPRPPPSRRPCSAAKRTSQARRKRPRTAADSRTGGHEELTSAAPADEAADAADGTAHTGDRSAAGRWAALESAWRHRWRTLRDAAGDRDGEAAQRVIVVVLRADNFLCTARPSAGPLRRVAHSQSPSTCTEGDCGPWTGEAAEPHAASVDGMTVVCVSSSFLLHSMLFHDWCALRDYELAVSPTPTGACPVSWSAPCDWPARPHSAVSGLSRAAAGGLGHTSASSLSAQPPLLRAAAQWQLREYTHSHPPPHAGGSVAGEGEAVADGAPPREASLFRDSACARGGDDVVRRYLVRVCSDCDTAAASSADPTSPEPRGSCGAALSSYALLRYADSGTGRLITQGEWEALQLCKVQLGARWDVLYLARTAGRRTRATGLAAVCAARRALAADTPSRNAAGTAAAELASVRDGDDGEAAACVQQTPTEDNGDGGSKNGAELHSRQWALAEDVHGLRELQAELDAVSHVGTRGSVPGEALQTPATRCAARGSALEECLRMSARAIAVERQRALDDAREMPVADDAPLACARGMTAAVVELYRSLEEAARRLPAGPSCPPLRSHPAVNGAAVSGLLGLRPSQLQALLEAPTVPLDVFVRDGSGAVAADVDDCSSNMRRRVALVASAPAESVELCDVLQLLILHPSHSTPADERRTRDERVSNGCPRSASGVPAATALPSVLRALRPGDTSEPSQAATAPSCPLPTRLGLLDNDVGAAVTATMCNFFFANSIDSTAAAATATEGCCTDAAHPTEAPHPDAAASSDAAVPDAVRRGRTVAEVRFLQHLTFLVMSAHRQELLQLLSPALTSPAGPSPADASADSGVACLSAAATPPYHLSRDARVRMRQLLQVVADCVNAILADDKLCGHAQFSSSHSSQTQEEEQEGAVSRVSTGQHGAADEPHTELSNSTCTPPGVCGMAPVTAQEVLRLYTQLLLVECGGTTITTDTTDTAAAATAAAPQGPLSPVAAGDARGVDSVCSDGSTVPPACCDVGLTAGAAEDSAEWLWQQHTLFLLAFGLSSAKAARRLPQLGDDARDGEAADPSAPRRDRSLLETVSAFTAASSAQVTGTQRRKSRCPAGAGAVTPAVSAVAPSRHRWECQQRVALWMAARAELSAQCEEVAACWVAILQRVRYAQRMMDTMSPAP